MKGLKRRLAVALCVELLLPRAANAGAMAGGATEATQISNNVQLTMSYATQAAQLARLVRQVAMMGQMIARFRDHGNAGAIVNGITGIVLAAQRMAFVGGSMAAQWRLSHPGAHAPEAAGHPSVEKAYEAIDKDLNRATEESLAALDVVVGPGATNQEEQILRSLRTKMMTAEGQMQAQQVANELLFEIVRQLATMRQVMLVQARMTAEGVSATSQRRLYEREQKQRNYDYSGRYRSGS